MAADYELWWGLIRGYGFNSTAASVRVSLKRSSARTRLLLQRTAGDDSRGSRGGDRESKQRPSRKSKQGSSRDMHASTTTAEQLPAATAGATSTDGIELALNPGATPSSPQATQAQAQPAQANDD